MAQLQGLLFLFGQQLGQPTAAATGNLTATLDAATLAADGSLLEPLVGDLTATLNAATLAATGTVFAPSVEGFGVGGPQVYDVFPIIGIAELYNVRHRTH